MKNIGKRLIAGATLAGAITLATLAGKGVLVNAATEYFNEKYYSAVIPDAYYTGVDTTLSGDAFIANLQPIISKNYNQHSYTANSTVLKYTDPDPEHPGKVIGFYSGASISTGAWNKEHVWAKSHGFPNNGDAPYCDAHHLRPTYNDINSRRGNLDFGETNATPDQYGNRAGDVFEPRDEVKGDVARIMFYMATRYSKSHNLKLVTDRITNRSDTNGRFGGLNTLLKWHYQDPVSKEEIYRNNVIYENYQHNRNPYIDHPEYVDLAYPNEYASYEVDQAKVDNVISLINALPTNIELTHRNQVNAANDAYLLLNFKEKQAVTNYSKLAAALNRIADLDKPVNPTPTPDPKPEPTPDPDTKPDTPVVPQDGDLSIDFPANSIGDVEYSANKVIEVNGSSFFMSGVYGEPAGKYNANDPAKVRLGNKAAVSLEPIGLSGTGHWMEPQFDMENLKSMNLSLNKTYSGYTGWEILFKEAGKDTYESVATGTGNDINAELSEAKTGRFVIVVKGDKPRCDLGVLNFYTAGPSISSDLKAFEEAELATSIRATYAGGEITKAQIRFGMSIENTALNGARYGVVVMPKESLSGASIKEMLKDTDANSFKSNDTYKVYSLNEYAKVSANKHQFAIVGTITKAPKLELCAAGFLVNDGKLYITRTATASFYNTALAYSNTLEAANKDLLQALLAKIN